MAGGRNISQQLLKYRRADLAPIEKATSGRGVVGNSGEGLLQFMPEPGAWNIRAASRIGTAEETISVSE